MNEFPTSDVQIRHSNVLTNARFEYSEVQLDLFFFILSNLRKNQDSLIYRLDIKELSVLTKAQYHLPRLVEAMRGMMKQVFSHNTERGLADFIMLEEVVYLTGTKIIEIKLTKTVLPHLFDLKNKFTSLALQAALRLTSKYSKRIYQLCSQWKDLGETKKYDIQEFKKMLGLIDEEGNEKLKAYKDFRKVVLDLSVNQINEHTDLFITYAPVKEGRSVKYITFTVKQQAVATPPLDLDETPSTLPGLNQGQIDNASKILKEVGIIRPGLLKIIMASVDHIMTVNRFNFERGRNKGMVKTNAAGLLLKKLGLV